MKQVNVTVYKWEAVDGTLFNSKEDCEEYEKCVRFFCVYDIVDDKETSLYMRTRHVAVFSYHNNHRTIAFEWALRMNGMKYVAQEKKEHEIFPLFSIDESSSKRYFMSNEEKFFLSPKPLDELGFPENFNYYKEWGFR